MEQVQSQVSNIQILNQVSCIKDPVTCILDQ